MYLVKFDFGQLQKVRIIGMANKGCKPLQISSSLEAIQTCISNG